MLRPDCALKFDFLVPAGRQDLSVKLEGTFALRYRIFNLSSFVVRPGPEARAFASPTAGSTSGSISTSTSASTSASASASASTPASASGPGPAAPSLRIPVLAECTGGPFVVYSTKEFPGLKASTVLTKHLARWGLKVTVRGVERKRKRGVVGTGGAPAQSANSANSGGNLGMERRGAMMGMGMNANANANANANSTNGRAMNGTRGRVRRVLRGAGDGDGAGVYEDEVVFHGESSVSDEEDDEGSF